MNMFDSDNFFSLNLSDAFNPHPGRCNCKGKDGKLKNLYATREAAEENARYCQLSRGVHLNVYECPEKKGWHLTSNQHQW